MQKIYSGKQLDILYAQAAQLDRLSARDHIERAAVAFERELLRHYALGGRSIYVFAGAGRCGAYALSIAQLLARKGYTVFAYLFYRGGKLSPECEAVREQLSADTFRLEDIFTDFAPPRILSGDLIIDGLFGADLQTTLSGGYVALVDFLNATEAPIVSIEIPSGLFAEDNSGNTLEHVIRAERTIAFDSPKLAFFFRENDPYVGAWSCLSLGISPQAQQEIDTAYYYVQDVSLSLSLLKRPRFSIELPREKVLFLTRQLGHIGKTLLATRAAYRAGCSELHAVVPSEESLTLSIALPELTVDALTDNQLFDQPLKSYKAIVVGDGFGTDDDAFSLFELLMASYQSRPLLIESDGIALLSRDLKLLKKLPSNSILIATHKELDDMAGYFRSDRERLERALELASNCGVYIILRGTYSAVCTPTGAVFFDTTGNTGLQTNGASNVLSGVIAGLLGQGYQSITAAVLGLHLVGLSAELYAGRYSERSLTATSLIDLLGEAYHQLEAK